MDLLPADCLLLVVHAVFHGVEPDDKLVQMWLLRGISSRFKQLVDDDRPDWFAANGYPRYHARHPRCAGSSFWEAEAQCRGTAFIRGVLRISAECLSLLDWACGGPTEMIRAGQVVVFSGPSSAVVCRYPGEVDSIAASFGRAAWLRRFPSSRVSSTATAATLAGQFGVARDSFRQLFWSPADRETAVNNVCQQLLSPYYWQPHSQPASFVGVTEFLVEMKREAGKHWREALPTRLEEYFRVHRALTCTDDAETIALLHLFHADSGLPAVDEFVLGRVYYHVALAGRRRLLDQLGTVPENHRLWVVVGAFDGSRTEILQWVDTWWAPGYVWRLPSGFDSRGLLSNPKLPHLLAWLAHHELTALAFSKVCDRDHDPVYLDFLDKVADRPCAPVDTWLRSINPKHPKAKAVALDEILPDVIDSHDPEDMERAGLIGAAQKTDPHVAEALAGDRVLAHRRIRWVLWMDASCWTDTQWCRVIAHVCTFDQWSVLAQLHGRRCTRKAIQGNRDAVAVIDYLQRVGHLPRCYSHQWYPPSKRLLL